MKSYSREYNRLAERALYNKENGDKEIYLFAEPGFIPTFIYLTNNDVKTDILYTTNGQLDENKLDISDYIENETKVYMITKTSGDGLFNDLEQKYLNANIEMEEYVDCENNFFFIL